MAPKQTPYQLSKGLGYQAKTPAFLLALQQRVAGNSADGFDDRGDRPPIPTRPEGEASGDDESEDEKPQVVVLKEGKHLSELEVENERRKAKGLPPKVAKDEASDKAPTEEAKPKKGKDKDTGGLSFSSSVSSSKPTTKASSRKRKGPALGGDDGEDDNASESVKRTKKPKKESKGLLSFGDGD